MVRALNLDPLFDPTKYLPIPFELPILPGGELHPKLDKSVNYSKIDKVVITQRANNSNDIFAILFIVDALRRVGVEHFDLVMPYIPYARQDRYDIEDNFGESFTLDVFANIINSIGFEKVYVLDAHSDVSKGLIYGSCEIRNHEYVDRMLRDIFGNLEDKRFNLIAIDAGVSKKIDKLATYLWKMGWTNFDIIQCTKKRDIATGKLSGFQVHADDLYEIPCILVDDICDGGGSFAYASQELFEKKAKDLYGFFSHGIFSGKAIELLSDFYQGIYTTNSIRDIVHPNVTQFEFKI
jgi:ribose-phosphate pyrophosphokinase